MGCTVKLRTFCCAALPEGVEMPATVCGPTPLPDSNHIFSGTATMAANHGRFDVLTYGAYFQARERKLRWQPSAVARLARAGASPGLSLLNWNRLNLMAIPGAAARRFPKVFARAAVTVTGGTTTERCLR